MNRKLRSIASILLAALLCAPIVFGQQPVGEETLTLPHSEIPIVQIQTVELFASRHLLSALEGEQLNAREYQTIGDLTGFGTLRIDDRPVQSGLLYSGSRVQVGAGSCARVELASHGQIMLAADSDLSIAADADTVYAKLIAGKIRVELPAGVSGVIEGANTLVMNRPDTAVAFNVRLAGDRMVVDAPDGSLVQDQATADDEYEIAFLTRREEKMKPNHSLELQVKVTDKQHRPRPGTPVLFESRDVSGNVSTSFSQTSTVTDADGIARVSVSVGPNNGKVLITASVPGTLAAATMTISVHGGLIFGLSTTKTLAIAGAAAAAGVGIQQGISNSSGNKSSSATPTFGNQIIVIGSGNR